MKDTQAGLLPVAPAEIYKVLQKHCTGDLATAARKISALTRPSQPASAEVVERGELIEKLLNDAFSVLHHDVSEDSAAGIYERATLRKKFAKTLQAGAAVQVPENAGVCAFDRDECTVTLALDTEEQVNALIALLKPKNRVRLMDDAAAQKQGA